MANLKGLPVASLDCWIGDEDGGNRVWFRGSQQPKPIPMPERSWQGTISGLLAPNVFRVDSAGYGPKQLTWNLSLLMDTWEQLEQLLERFSEASEEDGPAEHLPVQCSNSFRVYKCTPVGELKPVLSTKRPFRVAVTVTLLINEQLS